MKRLILLTIMLGLLATGSTGQEPGKRQLICGFDSRADLAGISFSTKHTLVTDKQFVTQGAAALKLTFAKGAGWPGFTITGARLKGWQNYDLLVMDVRNLSDKRFGLTMRFDDARTNNYETRAHFGKTLRPGATTIKIPLKLLKRENGKPFNLATLRRFIVFTGTRKSDSEIVFDNLRLENEEAVTTTVPGARMFDFGAATSQTFGGFVKVTPKDEYRAERGYGFTFTSAAKLNATNSALPDDLLGDYVHASNLTFRVDLPNGSYRVHVSAFHPDQAYSVKIGTAVVAKRDAPKLWPTDGLYRGIGDDYYPGKDMWKSYVEPDYPTHKATVTVTGGALEVVCQDAKLAALIIYRANHAERMKPVLADVLKRRREQFTRDYCTIEIPQPNTLPPKPTTVEKTSGYMIFFPRITDMILPTTLPTGYRRTGKLKPAAARGQRVSATFAICPIRAFKQFQVRLSSFKSNGPDGRVLGSRNLQIRLVRYFERKVDEGTYVPKPTQLVKRDVPLHPGFTRQYWLTVDVPTDTKPGTYAGHVALSDGASTNKIPVELTVYPFTLPEHSKVSFAFYCHSPFGKKHLAAKGANLAEALEPEIIDMKRHGLNTMQLPLPRIVKLGTDRIQLDFSDLAVYAALMKKHDFGIKRRPQMFTINLANYLKRRNLTEFSERFNLVLSNTLADIDKWFKARRMEVIFWLVDEPREQAINPWNRNRSDTIKYLKLTRKIPNIKTTVTVMADENHGVSYLPMVPLMDVIQTHPWAHSEKIIDMAHRTGKPVLHLDNAGTDRLSYGLLVWKTKALGRWQWHYQWPDTSYHPFQGYHWAVVYPSPKGPVPTVAYEQVAAGIADYRYVEMLEGLIEQADRRRIKVDDAKRLLKEIDAGVPRWPVRGLGDGTDVGEAYIGGVNLKLDRWRERLAAQIIALNKALGR